ncbi:MAG: RluA family pseudouridine synthase [Myxococcota bacterium]|nr:RluA family pseudouridine synthase [Myxococcota bacterium]
MRHRPCGIDPEWIELVFVVPREYSGWRVDRFIANRIPRLSRTRVQRILTRAGFDAQGRLLKPNYSVSAGEHITLYRPRPDEPDVNRTFGVLFEDKWILAVDKPAGLPVHPTARFHRNTLTALLREQYGDTPPILAHRIDRETSGVLLCAKTREAERLLKVMFAKRGIAKRYLAIVRGMPAPRASRIEIPLGPDVASPIRVKMAHQPDGLSALTEYRVLTGNADASLVECRPRTGRQHQIRAHFESIGHPIVGDKMYGVEPALFLSYLANGLTPDLERRFGAQRQLLHASAVMFCHPLTGEDLALESPLPDDMQMYARKLSSSRGGPFV